MKERRPKLLDHEEYVKNGRESKYKAKSKYLETLRGDLFTATSQMLESIDKKLNIFRTPDSPSTHVDDLSAHHLCRTGSSPYEDP